MISEWEHSGTQKKRCTFEECTSGDVHVCRERQPVRRLYENDRFHKGQGENDRWNFGVGFDSRMTVTVRRILSTGIKGTVYGTK